jgi:hypothetical protein
LNSPVSVRYVRMMRCACSFKSGDTLTSEIL